MLMNAGSIYFGFFWIFGNLASIPKQRYGANDWFFFFHFHFSQNVRNTENDKTTPNESAGAQDSTQLIALGTPIQFDIVLPATEFLDQNRGGRYGQRQELFTLSDFRGEY